MDKNKWKLFFYYINQCFHIILFLTGLTLIDIGIFLFSTILGLITAGIFLVFIGILIARPDGQGVNSK